MKLSKSILLVSLFAVTPSVFAKNADLGNIPDDFAMVAGKKITIADTRKTLIKKFGKPKADSDSYSNWEFQNNISITANYEDDALANLGVNSLNPSITSNYVLVGGEKIYLNKDTINTALSKVKNACFENMTSRGESIYEMFSDAQYGGDWYKTQFTTLGKGNIKALRNIKISSFNFGYSVESSQKNCNY